MLHTKVRGNRVTDSREDVWSVLPYTCICVAAILVMIKISQSKFQCHYPRRLQIKTIQLDRPSGFKKKIDEFVDDDDDGRTDGRRTDGRRVIAILLAHLVSLRLR